MKTTNLLLATSAFVAARALASNHGSMEARSVGDNIGAMTAKLHTFDNIVYAPVTDCKIFTSYTPSALSPPAATGGQAGSGGNLQKVRVSIIGFAEIRNFDNVPADDSIFIVGSGIRGVSVNEMEVVDGPTGVVCTAWQDRKAKVQIGAAVPLGQRIDLVRLEEASDTVRSLRCAIE